MTWEGAEPSMADLEHELKHLIVEALLLEDVKAEEIDSHAPLFVEGLGLDSIDALELVLAINRKYGVEIKADTEGNKEAFRSLNSLAAFVKELQGNRGEGA
jgi:acyl carrier protein